MGGVIEDMVDYVWPPPRKFKMEPGGRKNPNNWLKWGFTIYRTYYGEESDEAWQMLLHSLRHQTKLAFGRFADKKDTNQDDVQRLKDLFRLDVREDASLNGLDVRGLRKFCNSEKDKLIHIDDQGWRHTKTTLWPPEDEGMAEYVFDFVLLADEAVLKDIAGGESIVKAVSLRWREGYSAFGWMRIPTGYLLELWTILMWWDDRTERALSFRGPESELDYHIWPGDAALADTGACSEAMEKDQIPAGEDDCSGIWTNKWYCAGVPGTPTSAPAKTTATATKPIGAPKPSVTQEGLTETCTSFHRAGKGETCAKILSTYGTLDFDNLFKWNPAVGKDCDGIWAGYSYCVGVPGTPTAPPSSTTPKPTISGEMEIPSPIQENMVSNCKKFHQVASTTTCASIQKYYKITLSQLAKWNPAVGVGCEGLWTKYWVCAGV